MHKILRCLCLQYQKQMQLSCFYRGIVLKCLLTKSVPDGKWTVDAPSARAIIHAILFELRPGTRQNDGGLKINTRSSSERRCWDGNICGLCTRRPFIGGQDCPMENWPSNKDELDAILNIPTSILIFFFFETTFSILFAPFFSDGFHLIAMSFTFMIFDDAVADISIHIDNCWSFFQQQTNIQQLFFFFIQPFGGKTTKINKSAQNGAGNWVRTFCRSHLQRCSTTTDCGSLVVLVAGTTREPSAPWPVGRQKRKKGEVKGRSKRGRMRTGKNGFYSFIPIVVAR